MNEQDFISWKKLQQKWVSRRNLIRGAAGTALGAGLLRANPAYAGHDDDDHRGIPKPIPHNTSLPFGPGPFHFYFAGPVEGTAFATTDPFGAHSEGRNPSTITDFCGSIGQCDINVSATGVNTVTKATTPYAFHADLRFMSGRFIGTDGDKHQGTLAFI
jgi:hypothetical protein